MGFTINNNNHFRTGQGQVKWNTTFSKQPPHINKIYSENVLLYT